MLTSIDTITKTKALWLGGVVAVFVAAITAAGCSSSPLALTDILAEVESGVVQIGAGRSNGSGFIFETIASDDSALVLTNYHVIEGHTEVKVRVRDTVTYSGRVQGIDPERDLAVVRICCGNFTALPFGDARDLEAGVDVLAMGYPVDVSGTVTVTKGIVSANWFDSYESRWIIQTDAPINPGNSGGPLLTAGGRVIGINTLKWKVSGSGEPVEGLGFAVSEVTVRAQLEALKAGRYRPTPTPASPDPGWEKYVHPAYGYSISFPSSWELNASDDDRLTMPHSDSFAVTSGDGMARVSIDIPDIDIPRDIPGEDVGAIMDKFMQEFTKSKAPILWEGTDFAPISVGPKGLEGARQDFRYQMDQIDCVIRENIVALVVKPHFYVIRMTVCEDSLGMYEGTFESIFDSFAP